MESRGTKKVNVLVCACVCTCVCIHVCVSDLGLNELEYKSGHLGYRYFKMQLLKLKAQGLSGDELTW